MVNPKYKALLRVAETGSFTQAANDLGYSQSGISGMISSLEKEMGVQLVVRDYGEVHLSAEGEDLLPWISNVCNGERQLASRIAELRRLERGAVRIAAPTSISTHWFPGMVKAFERKCPGVELHLMCIDDEAELERALWHGDADCGFLVAPAKRALKAIPLHDDPIMVLLPPDHALAHADHVPARTLAEEPFIQPRSRSMQEAEALLRNSGVKPRVRFAVDSDYNVMNMVSKGWVSAYCRDCCLKIPCSPWPCSRRIWRCGGRYPSPCDLRTPPRPPRGRSCRPRAHGWRSATSNDKGEETVAQPRTASIAAGAATRRTQAYPEQPQARQPA